MLVVEQNIALENIIHELGYADLKSFANQQAKEVLWNKVKICDNKIKAFEHKYGFDYKVFSNQFHSITLYNLFEKEDDGMLWDAEISLRNHYLELIKKLA
jgi:ribosomal protein RSM22 (predicted rRNA methylase)